MKKRKPSEKDTGLYKHLHIILPTLKLSGKGSDDEAWQVANFLKRREVWDLSVTRVTRALYPYYKAIDKSFTRKRIKEEYYKALPYLIQAGENRMKKERKEHGWANSWILMRMESRRYKLWCYNSNKNRNNNVTAVNLRWIFWKTLLAGYFQNDERICPLSRKEYIKFAKKLGRKNEPTRKS